MVIVALDFKSKEETINFLKDFREPIYVKVGMTLFYSEGPKIIEEIKKMGHHIFLDLKLHDIPFQVKEAMLSLTKLDVDIINVHAKGGYEMMFEAITSLRTLGDKRPLLIAVTELTSTDQKMLNEELRTSGTVIESVINLASLAKKAELDGVVCSALEVEEIKKACGKEFLTVTPGIRYSAGTDDQKRVVTPSDAKIIGCDYIVVGRPITKALNPYEAYVKIRKEFMGE